MIHGTALDHGIQENNHPSLSGSISIRMPKTYIFAFPELYTYFSRHSYRRVNKEYVLHTLAFNNSDTHNLIADFNLLSNLIQPCSFNLIQDHINLSFKTVGISFQHIIKCVTLRPTAYDNQPRPEEYG